MSSNTPQKALGFGSGAGGLYIRSLLAAAGAANEVGKLPTIVFSKQPYFDNTKWEIGLPGIPRAPGLDPDLDAICLVYMLHEVAEARFTDWNLRDSFKADYATYGDTARSVYNALNDRRIDRVQGFRFHGYARMVAKVLASDCKAMIDGVNTKLPTMDSRAAVRLLALSARYVGMVDGIDTWQDILSAVPAFAPHWPKAKPILDNLEAAVGVNLAPMPWEAGCDKVAATAHALLVAFLDADEDEEDEGTEGEDTNDEPTEGEDDGEDDGNDPTEGEDEGEGEGEGEPTEGEDEGESTEGGEDDGESTEGEGEGNESTEGGEEGEEDEPTEGGSKGGNGSTKGGEAPDAPDAGAADDLVEQLENSLRDQLADSLEDNEDVREADHYADKFQDTVVEDCMKGWGGTMPSLDDRSLAESRKIASILETRLAQVLSTKGHSVRRNRKHGRVDGGAAAARALGGQVNVLKGRARTTDGGRPAIFLAIDLSGSMGDWAVTGDDAQLKADYQAYLSASKEYDRYTHDETVAVPHVAIRYNRSQMGKACVLRHAITKAGEALGCEIYTTFWGATAYESKLSVDRIPPAICGTDYRSAMFVCEDFAERYGASQQKPALAVIITDGSADEFTDQDRIDHLRKCGVHPMLVAWGPDAAGAVIGDIPAVIADDFGTANITRIGTGIVDAVRKIWSKRGRA